MDIKNKEIYAIKMSIGEDCFLRCKYCYVDNMYQDRTYQKDSGITRHDCKAIIDLFMSSSGANKFLQFIGGEPLMYWDILRFAIEYTRLKEKEHEKNVVLFFVTNGLLIDNNNIKFLATNNVKIGVSIDGMPYFHDKYRHDKLGKGTYHGVSEKMGIIKKHYNKKDVGISMTIHKNEVSYIFENFKYLASKYDCTILSSLTSGIEWSKEEIQEAFRQFILIHKYIINNIKKNKFVYFNGLNYLVRHSRLLQYHYEGCLWNTLECFKNGDIAFYASKAKNYNTPIFNINDNFDNKEEYFGCNFVEGSTQCKDCVKDYVLKEDLGALHQIGYYMREDKFIFFKNFIYQKAKSDALFARYIRGCSEFMYFND